MYFRLAFQNVKRSIKDYLIYIMTLTACISLFYAFLSITSRYYRPDIDAEFNLEVLGDGMLLVIILITMLLIFLVQYVNRFMIRNQQKEFAVQSIMGMEQSMIAGLFFIETLVMGLFSLVLGIVLGVIFSQFITAMLLQVFQKPFVFSFMLFPDTVFLTVFFFGACFAIVGLFQIRTIRKIKIIDMLHADRKNEAFSTTHKWVEKVLKVNFILFFLMGIYSIRTLTYYLTDEFQTAIQIWVLISIVIPFVMVGLGIAEKKIQKSCSHVKYLLMVGLVGFAETITVSLLPVWKMYFALPMDKGAFNLYLAFIIWCLIFLVSVFFVVFSDGLLVLKNRSLRVKYKEENLFFFGQILSKLGLNTLSMTLICLTLTLSISLFLLTPFLVEWAQGFLDKRVVYDIQIDSDYTAAENVKLLPETDYAFLDSFFEEKHITLKDNCTFSTYFLKASDVHGQSAITAISLSDYNHLMEMFGYEEISLAENEFATQWLSITPKSTMETFETQYDRIATDNGELTLSAIEPKTEELGEVIYSNQNVVLILPDLMCDKLTVANSYRYIMTESPLSYEDAEQLTNYFHEYMPMDGQEVYSVTTKTIERNDTSALIFIVQTGLIYSAIILFVICFTILSLQQLSDSGKYRYRFQVLRNMGVEENHIRRLVLKQLGIWFGVPVMVALLISSAFILFLFIGFSIQIRTYIGAWKLLQQVGTILIILFALLICYFTSTWILFRKSISQGQEGECNV
ncbi:MAG: ABC transporter permease [Faecalimonas umbilicata]|uniref:ABC transporter permease n=1 Tax=Faecalimonas umbilicata TaxID=1912855 RepID=UPI00300EE973